MLSWMAASWEVNLSSQRYCCLFVYRMTIAVPRQVSTDQVEAVGAIQSYGSIASKKDVKYYTYITMFIKRKITRA
jgi:hypothetical protein